MKWKTITFFFLLIQDHFVLRRQLNKVVDTVKEACIDQDFDITQNDIDNAIVQFIVNQDLRVELAFVLFKCELLH